MIVKIPATKAPGNRCNRRGHVSSESGINATVSFTVPQAIAVADAFERGLKRRENEGKDISHISSVCTIMVGRLDDWLKVQAEKQNLLRLIQAIWNGPVWRPSNGPTKSIGSAVTGCVCCQQLFAITCIEQSSSVATLVISPPHKWQVRFNASSVEVRPRMEMPVNPVILDSLLTHFPDFVRAYSVDGIATSDFDNFGATRRTLRQFLEACAGLDAQVRDLMIPVD